MSSVTIGNNVTSIGDYAFYGCGNLTSVTVESKNPVAIDAYTFSNRNNATLRVPSSGIAAYEAADYWKEFKSIVALKAGGPGYADIVNVLSVSDLYTLAGSTLCLPIMMGNENTITAFQFELELPEGVTVTSRQLSNRKAEDHSMGFSQLANGNYQFTAFSSNSKAFSGNSGTLVSVGLTIDASIAAGEYMVKVKNIVLTDVDGNQSLPADCSATLTVSDVKLGDANGDGTVNITDAVGIVNYILGKPAANFKLQAADVNKDGTVNITDAVGVVNHILGRITLSSRRKESAVREPQ